MASIRKNGWRPPKHKPLKKSASYVRGKPTVSSVVPKSLYRCLRGPWEHYSILLSAPLATVPFRVGEFHGRYVSCEDRVGYVVWEDLK